MAKEDSPLGLREGLARGASQACVYMIEARKTAAQVGMGIQRGFPALLRGMLESALTSGFVFGMYFSTYHSVASINALIANPVATFATSLVKIPLSNAMRFQHIGRASNVVAATKTILKTQGVRGLYNGYTLSIIEDMIEFDLRIRLYEYLKSALAHSATNYIPESISGVACGAAAGMVASYATSPIDVVRAHMSIKSRSTVQSVGEIFNNGGAAAFYRGARLRMLSNGTKYALFFFLYENLKFIK